MTSSSFAKAGILMLILVTTSVFSWELYVRSKGFDNSYDDGGPLWTHQRHKVCKDQNNSTVFIGSSRIKFDLDTKTWESLTHNHPIQLACVGSSPLSILRNLAADKNFKGNLIIDVTEVLFFNTAPNVFERTETALKYYKDETPAQKASFVLDHLLESQLVFLDKDRLSLNAQLQSLRIPNRPGVFEFPMFPPDFGRSKFNRQEYMTDNFLKDTLQQNQVKGIWAFFAKMSKEPPISGVKLDSLLNSVKVSVDKIKARGGQVIFVRTPSSGPFLMGETMGYPKEKYWNRLLLTTKCDGIHFSDYPEIAHFECPEFSHLSQQQAIVFTQNFVRILGEKGWKFSGTNQ
ncbi:MAG: hypothetical protein JWN78_1570 [Bacteroidota bacterium]|nr:hypothetical protein [Bacteroidota bacterium]